MWQELTEARKRQQYNKKKITRTLNDIAYGTDFLIVKLIKLFTALFMVLDNVQYENQVEELQEANRKLKETARSVMQQSADVSTTLRTRDIENIEVVLSQYEAALQQASRLIHILARQAGLQTEILIER